jgi:hypothetical protein
LADERRTGEEEVGFIGDFISGTGKQVCSCCVTVIGSERFVVLIVSCVSLVYPCIPLASAASSAEMTVTSGLPEQFKLLQLLAKGVFQEVGIDFMGQA